MSLKKCPHCNARYRSEVIHDRECWKKRKSLKSPRPVQQDVFVEPVEDPSNVELPIETPVEVVAEVSAETPVETPVEKPKKYQSKKVKP